MVRGRSEDGSPALLTLALAAVVVGLGALNLMALLARPLGLRPALVMAELGLVTPALLVAWLFGRAGRVFGAGPADLGVVARALGCGLALWLMGLGLMDVQARLWAPPAGYLEAFRSLHEQLRPTGALDALLSVAVIAVTPAVCEEIVFRGVLLPSFPARFGPWLALSLTSLLFGLIHVDAAAGGITFYRVPFAMLVGCGFGLLRQASDTLWAPLLAHAVLNGITFAAVPLFDEPAQPQSTTLPHPALGLLLLVLGATALARGLRSLRASSAGRDAPELG